MIQSRQCRDTIQLVQPSYDKELTDVEALVLFAIWQARQVARKADPNGAFDGLTNIEIHKRIKQELGKRGRDDGGSFGNVKRVIDKLVAWMPSPLLMPAPRKGRDAMKFHLAKSMVKWSTTARMLLMLDGIERTTREALITRVAELKMREPDGRLFGAAEIEDALIFCEEPPYSYVLAERNGRIGTTDRVKSEKQFLTLLRDVRDDESVPPPAST